MFVLVLSAIGSDFFLTQAIAREFVAVRLILFGLLAGLLMFIDSRLGPGDRGSRIWYLMMGAGAAVSLIIGLDLSGRYLLDGLHGIPPLFIPWI